MVFVALNMKIRQTFVRYWQLGAGIMYDTVRENDGGYPKDHL